MWANRSSDRTALIPSRYSASQPAHTVRIYTGNGGISGALNRSFTAPRDATMRDAHAARRPRFRVSPHMRHVAMSNECVGEGVRPRQRAYLSLLLGLRVRRIAIGLCIRLSSTDTQNTRDTVRLRWRIVDRLPFRKCVYERCRTCEVSRRKQETENKRVQLMDKTYQDK